MTTVTTCARACALIALALLTLAADAAASGANQGAKPQPAAPAPTDVFTVSTGAERWSLDDALPPGVIQYAGKSVPFAARQVTESVSGSGERQLLFPISWYEPYMSQNPELKYVVVRYDSAGARMIMAEYMPEKLSMPKADFLYDTNGKRYYKNLAVATKSGRKYFKQAIASGQESSDGGYWVDTIVIYSVDDAPAPAAATAKPKPAKPAPKKP